jgi:formylglycine-generating enzyme required for sulfatase activity
VDIPYDYWLGRFPVTNAQFETFVQAGGYGVERYWSEAKAVNRWRPSEVRDWRNEWRDRPREYVEPFNLANHPVVGVTWYEALAFTRWLTERWQAAGRLPENWQIRLPTEAEWEKAAKGGLSVPVKAVVAPMRTEMEQGVAMEENLNRRRRNPWGEGTEGGQANYAQSGIGNTSAVGSFPAGRGPYGCEELSGNVWEWVQSIYAGYPYDAKDGREQLDGTSRRVLRGGAYYSDENSLRGAFRNWYGPNYESDGRGVRLCASPFFTSDL